MVESYYLYVCENAHHAHWIIFILFLLAGCNFPISEDLLMIGGGAIASTCIPDHTLRLYLWILVGCYFSSWETYWIGRLLGPKLYQIRLFSHIITPERLDLLRSYYAKFGIFTFILGRFCPGGIRNVLFLSSGFTKMPFRLYVLRDGFAALISTTLLFYLGFLFGAHFNVIIDYVEQYSVVFLIVLVSLILVWIGYSRNKCKKEKNPFNDLNK
jgi:membrane-associated protein